MTKEKDQINPQAYYTKEVGISRKRGEPTALHTVSLILKN
jgi:hypothetical protein